jgi:hypothetical protein
VTYYAHGRTRHVLVWGARNALPPDAAHPKSQVKFSLNYAGGYGSFLGIGYWKHVSTHNVCGRYTGPELYAMVAACTAPNGTNWAIQAWQGSLPDNGWSPTSTRESSRELSVSHWSGPLPVLWFKADWVYAGARGGPYDHIYGQLSYLGRPVYGFGSSSRGAPTDSFGRIVLLDTRNPPWRKGYRQPDGWWRQNGFLTHRPGGDFCAGVYGAIAGVKTRNRPGRGDAYRVIANGPGVTPVVEWRSAPPGHYQPGLGNLVASPPIRGPYSRTLDQALNADEVALAHGGSCRHTH